MNAYTDSKEDLFGLGVAIGEAFLDANSIGKPRFTARALVPAGRAHGSYGCGHYVTTSGPNGTVIVDPNACASPAQGTAMRWSFPGYKVDRTPVGVTAHEVGHRVDHALGYPSNSAEWRIAMRGDKVSSYEPNASEAFAESMRILVTNFFFLGAVAPKRFAFLTCEQGLNLVPRPGYVLNGVEQLKVWGAAPKIIAAADKLWQRALR